MKLLKLLGASVALGALAIAGAGAEEGRRTASHVLLLSVDGLHGVDLEICVANATCPNLAALAKTGYTYANASTTRPSDSFPGLLAQLTGGTPFSTGVFYDDSYDRTLYSPGCASGPGSEVTFAENVDASLATIDGGVAGSLLTLNGAAAIDPTKLPGRKSGSSCAPVWPHNFVRVNTVFGVLHARGFRTAWADKHPAYDIINGPDASTPNGPGRFVDDFFAPEINSEASAANIALTHALGLASTAPDPTPIPGGDFTGSIDAVNFYDGIKVQAILNEIGGFDHTGTRRLGVPNLFGMNFQSVSVGQKLKTAGYIDPVATPSASLAQSIAFVDASIGKFTAALKTQGLLDRTLIIVSAKHGQAPIDRTKRKAFDDGAVIAAPIGANFAFDIADDAALIWLKDNSGAKTAAAVAALNAFAATSDTGVSEWLSGPLLTLTFRDPAIDARTPDIIGIARSGVIYTGGSKIGEHGGFNEDDTHVALLLSNPALKPETIRTPVATTQIAPTILEAFGVEPEALEAVRIEGARPLPRPDQR